MKTPQVIADLLDKPMDRRDFLKHVGIGILFVFGFGTIIKSIGGLEKLTGSRSSQQSYGYGMSAYSGRAQ